MELEAILQTVGIITGTLGGGAVVVFALSGWLGKVWAERLMRVAVHEHEKDLERIRDEYRSDLEKLRIRLKKSEFLFENEFAATSALVEYHEELIPLSDHPDMHMDDVYESIACRLGDVEAWIKQFVSKHGAVLPEDVSKTLMMAARSAGENKFRIGEGAEGVDRQAFNSGEYVYHCVRAARDSMRKKVWAQSST